MTTVDARGRPCPVPVIELARAAAAAAPGSELEVLSDDPAARHDVPAWCRMRGHDYLGERALDAGVAFRVRTRSGQASRGGGGSATARTPDART